MPLISVITPVYNSRAFLEGTARSVRAQTFGDFEHILIDDCSTDDSLALAQRLAREDERVRVIALPENAGAAGSRNAGIEAARGRYIAFLDSDDQWDETFLEEMLAFIRKQDCGLVFASYRVKSEDHDEDLGVVRVPQRVTYSRTLKTNSIGCLTAMYDTQRLGKVYMPSIRKRQDLGLWLRILKKEPVAYGNPRVLATYRARSHSISSNKLLAAHYQWRLYRQIEKLPYPLALYYFVNYFVYGFIKNRRALVRRWWRLKRRSA